MNTKRLLTSACLIALLSVCTNTMGQARIDLGEKPKIVSASPTERSATSTKYTEAEENRYIALVSTAYKDMLADSLTQAELAFKEATDLLPSHPANAEAFFQLGQIAERKNNYQTAADYYRKSTRINENLAKAFDRRGAVSLILRDYDTALKCYTKYLDLKPGDAQAIFYKGYIYQQEGKLDQALSQYQKVLDASPNHVSANTAVAVIKAGRGQHSEAISIMDNLISCNPKSASLYQMRGSFEMESQRTKLALYDFNKAIELDPTNPTSYINRAIVYGRSKQKAMSEADLQRAQELGAPAYAIESARNAMRK